MKTIIAFIMICFSIKYRAVTYIFVVIFHVIYLTINDLSGSWIPRIPVFEALPPPPFGCLCHLLSQNLISLTT